MREEADFLRQLTAEPVDLDTPLVYADWLEDHGQAARADFLRQQHRLLALRFRQPGQAALRRQLVKLGETLPQKWLAAVSRPGLAGTCWAARPRGGTRYVFRFLAEGVLNYTSPTGTFQNGTWRQVGPHVAMETNRHFADHQGLIVGDTLHGTARNIHGMRWSWTVRRTADPELCDPGDPILTVFDDHTRRRSRRRRRT